MDLLMASTSETFVRLAIHLAHLSLGAQVRPAIDNYLHGLVKAEVRTLEDIVRYNYAHPNLELPKGRT